MIVSIYAFRIASMQSWTPLDRRLQVLVDFRDTMSFLYSRAGHAPKKFRR